MKLHCPHDRPLRQFVLLLAACLLGSLSLSGAKAADSLEANAASIAISLPSSDGGSVHLRPSAEHRLQVICFLGCECPLAKLYAARLNQLADRYADEGVRFVGVNSNSQDSLDEVVTFAKSHALRFVIAKDHDGIALNAFAATRTPEVFLIDPVGRVVYQGRIDDQYRPGVVQAEPTRHDLQQAIEDYLAGRQVAVPRTQAAGCLIAKRRPVNADSDVTYCRQIAKIFSRHCWECHRDGEIGPFALTRYEEVVGWSDMILETIEEQRMPPWHAAANHEPLLNERRLTTEDLALVRRWVEAGAPYGDATELPPLPSFAQGWQLTKTPDMVFDVNKSSVRIPAEGVVEYQYFVVNTNFDEEVWVEAAEILPGNRTVLHHAIAFIRPPDGVHLDGLAMLTAYVPGQRVAPAKAGLAKRIPAGSKIVFQMHYTPTGSEQFDSSRLGLSIVDRDSVTQESITLIGINHDLEIPPGEANVVIEGQSMRFPENGELLSISPHMHLRGKSVSIETKHHGASRTILEVPKYDFNWQHTYLFRDPIKLADVQSISFSATFDNSASNPFNPDPAQFVTWGDQTWEEMAVVFYEVAKPLTKGPAEYDSKQRRSAGAVPGHEPGSTGRHQALTDELIRDLDGNGDGMIQYDELELSVKWRLFQQMDANSDRTIDRAEALKFIRATR